MSLSIPLQTSFLPQLFQVLMPVENTWLMLLGGLSLLFIFFSIKHYQISFHRIYKDEVSSTEPKLIHSLQSHTHSNHPQSAGLGASSDIQLKKALKGIEQFLSLASHQLKTPVTALQLQIQLIYYYLDCIDRGESVDRNEFRKILREMHSQFDRLTHFVNDLLDGAHASSGRLFLSLGIVNMNDLCKVVCSSVHHQPGIKLKISDENKEDIKIVADNDRIHQMLNNLLLYAMNQNQGNPIEVHLGSSHELSAWLEIETPSRVQDDITVERTDISLGMFINREIVTAHGGTITVSNTPHHKIRVEIPRSKIMGPF